MPPYCVWFQYANVLLFKFHVIGVVLVIWWYLVNTVKNSKQIKLLNRFNFRYTFSVMKSWIYFFFIIHKIKLLPESKKCAATIQIFELSLYFQINIFFFVCGLCWITFLSFGVGPVALCSVILFGVFALYIIIWLPFVALKTAELTIEVSNWIKMTRYVVEAPHI